MAKHWPAARAVLISMVVALGLVDGCPVPEHHATSAWARVDRARAFVLRPIRPVAELLAVRERWTLFRGASPHRYRLVVEGQGAGGSWTLLYRAGSEADGGDDTGGYGAILEYRRIRGSYSPSGSRNRAAYPAFQRWLTSRVLADHPELTAARVYLEPVEVQPGGGWKPTGQHTSEYSANRRTAPTAPLPATADPGDPE